jgi:hypothetical protein
MSPGESKIIRKSRIDPSLRDTLLTHDHLVKGFASYSYDDRTNYFTSNNPQNLIDQTVIKFLDAEEFDYRDKDIEYWFQKKTVGESLSAHCDYNMFVRNGTISADYEHKEYIMSPITLSVYLDISDDLTGGELCISSKDWFDYPDPIYVIFDLERNNYPYETYSPVQDEVLYFHGSTYYHWINMVNSGHRTSMLINFWPANHINILRGT